MLIPIILEKLPNAVQLQISRKLGKTNWDVEEFIKCVNEEVTARENCDLLKINEKDNSSERYVRTTQSLLTNNREIKCVFCASNHYSDECKTVTDVKLRLTCNHCTVHLNISFIFYLPNCVYKEQQGLSSLIINSDTRPAFN